MLVLEEDLHDRHLQIYSDIFYLFIQSQIGLFLRQEWNGINYLGR